MIRYLATTVLVCAACTSPQPAPAPAPVANDQPAATTTRPTRDSSPAISDDDRAAPSGEELVACREQCHTQLAKCHDNCAETHRGGSSEINREAGCTRQCDDNNRRCAASCEDSGEPTRFGSKPLPFD